MLPGFFALVLKPFFLHFKEASFDFSVMRSENAPVLPLSVICMLFKKRFHDFISQLTCLPATISNYFVCS